jgi:hypothetical protein
LPKAHPDQTPDADIRAGHVGLKPQFSVRQKDNYQHKQHQDAYGADAERQHDPKAQLLLRKKWWQVIRHDSIPHSLALNYLAVRDPVTHRSAVELAGNHNESPGR